MALFTDYLAGKVKVDEYVTHGRKFNEINAGFHDMHVSSLKSFIIESGIYLLLRL